MIHDIKSLAEQLARRAPDVCATYLFNGRRQGRYWLVGDVLNSPGSSLFVRLVGPPSGKGAAGKWTDGATGEHGDLVDLIRLNRGYADWPSLRADILAFLALPAMETISRMNVTQNSPAAAQRLFAMAQPISGTLAETYLRGRGITAPLQHPALKFHPSCYHRAGDKTDKRPALLAAVTDLRGNLTGILRTYLATDGSDKAAIEEPRRMLGNVLHHAIRLGTPGPVLAVGEGLETMLAVKSLLPALPVNAALGAGHLSALEWPIDVQRLYIAHDNGIAGVAAAIRLTERARSSGLDVRWLTPRHDDWNADLQADPVAARTLITAQLAERDDQRLQSDTGKEDGQRNEAEGSVLHGRGDTSPPGLFEPTIRGQSTRP